MINRYTHQNKKKRKYFTIDVKLWISRKQHENFDQSLMSIIKINEQIRKKVKEWQKEISKEKKRIIQVSNKNSNENQNHDNTSINLFVTSEYSIERKNENNSTINFYEKKNSTINLHEFLLK